MAYDADLPTQVDRTALSHEIWVLNPPGLEQAERIVVPVPRWDVELHLVL